MRVRYAVGLAGHADARRRAGGPLDRLPAKAGSWEALYARQQARSGTERARLRALAEARRSPTVEASLRVARLTGRITPNVEGRMRRDWARRQPGR